MKEKLSMGQIVSLSLMLFAMFFGAGNMIFPPMLGQQAGGNFVKGIAGFVATDAGLSVLGIAAIVLVGTKLDDLASLVNPKFATVLGVVVYFLIGPFFGLPRTGTVSFELAVTPFLSQGFNKSIASFLFTVAFFTLTYFLCLNPSKLVNIIGKLLTPALIVAIAVIFILSLLNPIGTISEPTGDYITIPFFRGMIEGYLALDGIAALAFAIIAINVIKEFGIRKPKNIVKYTIISGVAAEVGLAITYIALSFVGAQASSLPLFSNGGELLAGVVYHILGKGGNVVLGIAVFLACLTTSIGLASSFADYFSELLPKIGYKKILATVCLFSFAISNVGLTTLIKFSLPALIMIYPPIIALVLFSFANKWINGKSEAYALSMLFAFLIGICDGLKSMGISLGPVSAIVSKIPMFDLGLGWIIPAIVGCLIGMLPFVKFMNNNRETNDAQ